MKKILISAPYMMKEISRFKNILEKKGMNVIVADVRERLSEEDLLGIISEIDGIICGDDRLSEKALKNANKLKVISKWGTGTDSIDKIACKKYRIIFCSPGIN